MIEAVGWMEKLEVFLRSSVSFFLSLSAYWSLLLFRCALVSIPLIGIILLVRRFIPDRFTWLRAWCWSVFLLIPFLGKLHFWYESPYVWKYTGFVFYLIGDQIYLCFLWPLITSAMLVTWRIRARRLHRQISQLPQKQIAGTDIRVIPPAISPFSVGLLRPQIVIPEKYLEDMNDQELTDIVTHEKTHIRLGHLWVFALWKLLCILLFPNVLLRLSGKYIREDMEAVCDRVTMKCTNRTAAEYGRLILRAHRFSSADNALSPVTLTGERTYEEARRRILRICAFKPYRLVSCILLGLCCTAILGGTLAFIRQASYPRWSANNLVSVVDEDCHIKTFTDEEAIGKAFFYDRNHLIINRAAYEKLREADPCNVDTEHFWVCFDCFYKVPGIGGGGQLVEVDYSGDEEVLIIPYEWTTDFWTEILRYI